MLQNRSYLSCLSFLGLLAASLIGPALAAADAPKITYQDHILPILRNSCLSCHNPDKKKAGLDLSSYQGVVAGSSDGKVLAAGDPDASKLYKVIARIEEPYMPQNADKLPDKDVALFKQWIAGGAAESAHSKVAAVAKAPDALAIAAPAAGRPAGPPPMPKGLPKLSLVRTARPGAVRCMAASPWVPLLAVGAQRQILLYHADTLELLGALPFEPGMPCTLRFSRNGSLLLAGGGEAAKSGHVTLYNVSDGKVVATIGQEFDSVLAADISPDQSMVALGGPSKTLKVFATKDGQQLYSIKKHTDWITSIAFSPDNILLAAGDRAGNLYVFEARGGNEFYTLAGHKDAITALAFRDDSNVLASASQDGTVRLWDMLSGNALRNIPAHGGGALSLAFSHDGRLVSCGRDNTAKLWTADGALARQFDAFGDIVLHATITHDGSRAIAGDWTGRIRVFGTADGKPAGEITRPAR